MLDHHFKVLYTFFVLKVVLIGADKETIIKNAVKTQVRVLVFCYDHEI